MKILVTGSDGLIGSLLAERLESKNISVVRFDVKSQNCNILDFDLLKKAAESCDGVVHLAAVSRVVWGEQNPDLCVKVNEGGTRNVIDVALSLPKKPWVLYASSREVYGQQDDFPVKETAELKPMNIYARTKFMGEELIKKARQSELTTAIVRYANVYGSVYDHADRVIPAFCRASILGEDLRIDGIDNVFDFTYVDEVVDGTFRIIERLIQGNNNDIPTIHFVTGIPYTLLDVAKIAKSVCKSKSKIIEAPSRNFDVSKFYGDPTLAHQVLDWKAKILPEEGIERFIYKLKQYL